MNKLLLLAVVAIVSSAAAHAGLYDDLSKQEEARTEQMMREGEARDLARRIDIERNIVAQAMGVDPASVVYEGISRVGFEEGFEFNVGGVWGCLPADHGASCINAQTLQRQYFPLKSGKARARK
jgi:hypothetical protein